MPVQGQQSKSVLSELSGEGLLSETFNRLLSKYKEGTIEPRQLDDLINLSMILQQKEVLHHILQGGITALRINSVEEASIDQECWSTLRDAIPSGASIDYLHVRGGVMDTATATAMYEAARNMPYLQTLSLEDVLSQDDMPEVALPIVRLLVSTHDRTVQGNPYPLVEALLSKSQLLSLSIDLNANTRFSFSGLFAKLHDQHRLEHLSWKSPVPKPSCTKFIGQCTLFVQKNKSLKSLRIDHRRTFGDTGSTVLNKLIDAVKDHGRITEFALNGCFNGKASGAIRLDTLAGIPSLLKLELRNNKFKQDRDVLPMIQSLGTNKHLEKLELDLIENVSWFGDGGILTALEAALKKNTTLQSVCLPELLPGKDAYEYVTDLVIRMLNPSCSLISIKFGKDDGYWPKMLASITNRNRRFHGEVAGGMMVLLESQVHNPPLDVASHAAMVAIQEIGADAAGLAGINKRAQAIAQSLRESREEEE